MVTIEQVITEKYALYNGDCCEVIKGIPDGAIDYCVFSPPFADLYTYSSSERDMGNCKNYNEFFIHFDFLVAYLFRVLRPGRLITFHCTDIPMMKERDGVLGLKDFPGDLLRCFQKHGFIYHARHTIWKDPLVEATRTKAIGLLHKQLCKDSSISRSGLPDYLVTVRKPGENTKPIHKPHGLTEYIGDTPPNETGIKKSHMTWRAYASPVWMDIRQTRTLNRAPARSEKDEKHICPLQLDTIERCIELWSLPGETVLSPFMGIGSEGYISAQKNRKFIGIELKKSYFDVAVKNISDAKSTNESTLFDLNEME